MEPSAHLADKSFRVLAQSNRLIVGHIYEEAFLIDKLDEMIIPLGGFYGDPSCAAISPSDTWAVLGGEDRILIWHGGKIIEKAIDSPFELRVEDEQTVSILTDPWSDTSAIWQLQIGTFELIKMRDFPNYINQEYTEHVSW